MLWFRSRETKIDDLERTVSFQAQEIATLERIRDYWEQHHERLMAYERMLTQRYAMQEKSMAGDHVMPSP